MPKVWGYHASSRNMALFRTETEWEAQIDAAAAQGYLVITSASS
ncbi:MAG TPA: hypothetical protein VFF73_31505 [Planctomycetota bacterium]|nr:hypothetical protein [Planctomycetota bacterium]